jgi:hypothetical protein
MTPLTAASHYAFLEPFSRHISPTYFASHYAMMIRRRHITFAAFSLQLAPYAAALYSDCRLIFIIFQID